MATRRTKSPCGVLNEVEVDRDPWGKAKDVDGPPSTRSLPPLREEERKRKCQCANLLGQLLLGTPVGGAGRMCLEEGRRLGSAW